MLRPAAGLGAGSEKRRARLVDHAIGQHLVDRRGLPAEARSKRRDGRIGLGRLDREEAVALDIEEQARRANGYQ